MPSRIRFNSAVRILPFLLMMAGGLYLLYRMDFDVTQVFSSRHQVGGWMFVLAMSLLPVAGFPIAAFYLFAGATFGFWEGWSYCIVSLAANMGISYFVARYCMRDALTALLTRAGYNLPALSESNEYRVTFLLRSVPGPPFPVQNYVLALMGVRFPVYFSISLLVQGAIAAGMVACGGVLPETVTIGHVLVGAALLSILVGMKLLLWWRKERRAAAG